MVNSIGVGVGRIIRHSYRYLNNSNLNTLTAPFLTRKLYTSLDLARYITI